ncbi:MAG: hypothetical protein QOD26_2804 [Betaproteobacteria bacterium]|jgi:hypothetical protein|nr:hypothetical protein [Betaproteobacteria bacterium]
MRRPYLTLSATTLLLLAPLAALAFETIDTMPWASGGTFPAYPLEEIRPYEVYLQAGLMHDTNILRRNANAENENVFRFGAGGRVDQRVWGRQSIRLEGRGDVYHFDKFSDLDHFAYAGAATWLWELGNDLSGTIGYARTRRLAALTEVQRAVKRMVTNDDIVGTAAYRVGPSFRIRGLGAYSRGVRTTPGEDTVTFGTRSGTIGADLVSTLGNSLGIEHRQTRGDAPVSQTIDTTGQFQSNDFKERDTSVVAAYTSSPMLRFRGRVGHTERTYTDLPNNFSGTTYRAGVEWLPGTKTLLAFEVYKEPRAVIDIDASHVLVRGFAFGPAWAPTAKLAFSVRWVDEHRQFIAADPNVATPGTLLDETLRVFRFGIAWEPQRLMQVGLGLDRGNRESNTLGRNFNYTATMANIKVIW